MTHTAHMISQIKVSYSRSLCYIDTLRHIPLLLAITFAEVKRQLSQQEYDKAVMGETPANYGDLSPGDFIIIGLELEGIQYVFPMLLRSHSLLKRELGKT
jgi:hypothetical protein